MDLEPDTDEEVNRSDFDSLLHSLGIPSLLRNLVRSTRAPHESIEMLDSDEGCEPIPKMYPELISEKRFHCYYRISKQQFHNIHEMIQEGINMQTTSVRRSITTKERLLMCLRFLATGKPLNLMGATYGLGCNAVREIIMDVCGAIWQKMGPIYMPKPTAATWEESENVHRNEASFPNCYGALYGRRINLTSMNEDADDDDDCDYEEENDMVFLALVDAKGKFLFVDVGPYGDDTDGEILQKSVLGGLLENGELNMPDSNPGTRSTDDLPNVIVTDESFPLRPYLLRPYSTKELRDKERNAVFNLRLHRARYTADIAIGDLKSRWRAFNLPLPIEADMVETVVMATCCLYNYLDSNNMPPDHRQDRDDLIESATFSALTKVDEGFSPAAFAVRKRYKKYFCEEGALPWQWAHTKLADEGMDLSEFAGLEAS